MGCLKKIKIKIQYALGSFVFVIFLMSVLFYRCIVHNYCPAMSGVVVIPGSTDKYIRLVFYGFMMLMALFGLYAGFKQKQFSKKAGTLTRKTKKTGSGSKLGSVRKRKKHKRR